MNIASLLRSTVTSSLPGNSGAHINRAAPDPSNVHKGPHAINFGAGAEKPSKINFAEPNSSAGGGLGSLGSFVSMLSGLLDSLKQLLTGLENNAGKPFSPASNGEQNSANASSTQRASRHSTGADMAGYDPKASKTYKAADLVAGFSQSRGTENCVTIAEMKASMQKFGGPGQIYASINKTENGFDVTMRDNPNKKYHVTNQELTYAANHSGFKGNNEQMLKDANFMYAVSTKRAQMEGNDGKRFSNTPAGFARAMHSLNDWEQAQEGFDRLGLHNRVRRSSAQELANGAVGALLRDGHSVAVINGREDNYGNVGSRPSRQNVALKLV